ncbi:hypothetical protein GWC95_10495 [Sediminibacterium roseum]|uniref:Esterase n=1 Tax=Sediminibacterium roseum TaxID=1978412 RepID=A0ABW9ZXB9_9BACT|nr:alpha/beta hydrolase-fold protein [Sediminibacterium roseum]NCI50352.1 hypothetical protein [Sediminibacterium roseum]
MRIKLVTVFSLLLATAVHAQVKVYVHLDTSIHTSFTGRLILLTQNDTTKEIGQDLSPQASFAMNVVDWKPGEVKVFDDNAEASGARLSQLKPGYYKLASTIHIKGENRTNTSNPGNAYTRGNFIFYIPDNHSAEKHLYINTVFRERAFRETATLKLLNLKSGLLSAFHHKDVFVKAAVVLPDSVSTGEKYPVVFIIPGWGGTHYDAQGAQPRQRYGMGQGKKKIYVYLNPETQTRWGLHAFVDSDVNGPWGRALVKEVIPYLQEHYPAAQTAENYFLVGQSSGGYGAAWLQLNYPNAFNGCWAVSPDPVDFSNFTGIDLYKERNVYTDEAGKERGMFLEKGVAATTLSNMVTADDFTGDGGQYQSFEAEFGKPDRNGRPQQLYDRRTGAIDREVVKAWSRYDLGRYIQQHWNNDLPGKVHIYAGAEDNFHLDKSVSALAAKAKTAKADLVAEIIPGANHWTIWSPAFTKRVQAEIDARIR